MNEDAKSPLRATMPRTTRRPSDASRWSPRPSTILLGLWGLFIAYGTMLPFDFRADAAAATAELLAATEAIGRPISRLDVVSNVLLFVPWGVLWAVSRAGRGGGLASALTGATLGGTALSASMEFAQLFLPSRTTSQVDLMTNTAGSALGALLGWWLSQVIAPRWSPQLGALIAGRPMAACALAGALGLAMSGLAPYDVSIDFGDLKNAIKAAHPVPFGTSLGGHSSVTEPWSWAVEILAWALAGGIGALALREAGKRGVLGVITVIMMCGGLALAIELSQLAIRSRTTDATTVVMALLGSTLGAITVATTPGRSPGRWSGPALIVVVAILVLTAWTPPRLAEAPQWPPPWSSFVPFGDYYRRTDVYALADVLNQVLGFVPLGMLLTARGGSRPIVRSVLLGFAIGLLLETGQLALADRTGEITDVLTAAAGTALGAWLWLRITSLSEGPSGMARDWSR